MPDAPQITKSSWLMILLLAFIWGGTFLVTEIALTEMPPFWIAATRVGFAATVMIVIFIGAASSAVPFSLLAWGQQYVTSGFAGVTMAATALIILPLAHFFVPGEAMSPRKVIGFALGFVGVVILIGAQAFENTGTALETQGRLACLGAAGCYATSSIIMRRLPAVDAIGLATILLIIATCITIPMAIIIEGLPPRPSPAIFAALAFLGLIPTAAANFLRVLVIRSAGPVFMSGGASREGKAGPPRRTSPPAALRSA